MDAIELIKNAGGKTFSDEDGETYQISLFPGLSDEELEEFQHNLPFSLPNKTKAFLKYCRGFDGGPFECLDFSGMSDYLSFLDVEFCPSFTPIAADGFGNYWIFDLSPQSEDLGPIYYYCHDAPVFLFQSSSIDEFLIEPFKMCEPPFKSLIDDVHEDRIKKVWTNNPGLLSIEECLSSSDEELQQFAAKQEHDVKIIDLRDPSPGEGFSWGRCSVIKRDGYTPIYALKFKESIFKKARKLFKRGH